MLCLHTILLAVEVVSGVLNFFMPLAQLIVESHLQEPRFPVRREDDQLVCLRSFFLFFLCLSATAVVVDFDFGGEGA